MDLQLQNNAHAHKMYLSTQGVLGLPHIVYELGLWNPALKENGLTQQVLVWLYLLTFEKTPSGDSIGYFAKLGVFITRQILQGYD